MRLLWGALLAGFGALNIYGFIASDFAGLVAYFRNLGPWGIVATADLTIALFIGMTWMWQDARAKGLSALPYVVLTIATGSIGLLAYLVRHGNHGRSTAG
ncbi:MAG: DUF2834 domain-containing protein [bacterium]